MEKRDSFAESQIELILLDGAYRRLCAVRSFTSLRWTERYYSEGEFELLLPERYTKYALEAAFVYRKDKRAVGLIQSFRKEDGDVVLKGGFLEELLKTRVLDRAVTYSGLVHNVCGNLISDFCITPQNRRIPKLALGGGFAFEKAISFQMSGKTVYEALREILTEQEASFRLRYDIHQDTVFFEIFKGLDRSTAQKINDWCVFSGEFFNILSQTYEQSEDTRNFAYVAYYSGNGADRTEHVAEVDMTEGGQRRELFVDAKDIQRTEELSEQEFLALLYERGLQRLAEYNGRESVECQVDHSKMGNMTFALGDLCTFRNGPLGITAHGRVTEIEEITENGEKAANIILGKEQLNLVQKIKREKR